MRLFLLLPLLLVSCEVYNHNAVASSGNSEHDLILGLGGQSAQHGGDGSTYNHNHDTAFNAAMMGSAAMVGSWAAATIQKAKEETARMAAQQVTQQQAIAAKLAAQQATTAARQAVTTASVGANPTAVIPPVVTPP